ncbi:hypothetical protein APUTEX25_001337, partial [Auxenochlorella protothecoides]
RLLAWAVVASLGGVTADALLGHGGHPETWALACLCLWAGFLVSRGPRRFTAWELRNVLWASASLVSFAFLLLDGDLNSWADVFYFCGEDMRYCTSDYRWNVRGWRKAVALWNFMLAGAMGLQRLVIVLGLNGLHPGEDVVTQESFVSIGWRLIPYWLNNWEQQWGAECSSMVFELPHFALELLVVLPCVQILCARLKILAQPHVAAALPPEDAQAEAAGEGPGDERDAPVWTPNILACRWERRRGQRRLLPRLKANLRAMSLTLFVCSLALLNALTLFLAARAGGLDVVAGPLRLRSASDARGDTTGDAQVGAADGMPGRAAGSTPAHPNETVAWLRERQGAYWARRLAEAGAHARRSPELRLVPLYRALHKHARELAHMRDQGHRRLFPLVELALCIMRLSCERFFTLLAVWAGYLAFRDPPAPARRAIVTVARLAAAFQRAVLLAFPAVCWVYDAGIVFSTFASIVFWSGPLRGAVEKVRSTAASVEPHGWRHATAAEVERMGGQCAVCWGTLGPEAAEVAEVSAPAAGGDTAGAEGANSEPGSPPATSPAPRPARSWLSDRSAALRQAASAALSGRGPLDLRTEEEVDSAESAARWAAVDAMALPCGHAYHADCILQWLQQCFSQGRVPTCPMCQATIALRVRYHWPFRAVPRSRLHDEPVQPQFGVEGDGGLDPGIRGIRMLTYVLRDDFRNRFEVFLAPDQAQQPVGLEVPQPNDVRQPLWG